MRELRMYIHLYWPHFVGYGSFSYFDHMNCDSSRIPAEFWQDVHHSHSTEHRAKIVITK